MFNYGELIGLFGTTTEGTTTIQNPFVFWIVIILISAVFIPIQILELGEEIGWRGYVLPKQVALYGVNKAMLINGFWWGIAHLPLIYFGFNYSLENRFAPWSNMLLMMLVCIVMGIMMSCATIMTQNCMYASIMYEELPAPKKKKKTFSEIHPFVQAKGKKTLRLERSIIYTAIQLSSVAASRTLRASNVSVCKSSICELLKKNAIHCG